MKVDAVLYSNRPVEVRGGCFMQELLLSGLIWKAPLQALVFITFGDRMWINWLAILLLMLELLPTHLISLLLHLKLRLLVERHLCVIIALPILIAIDFRATMVMLTLVMLLIATLVNRLRNVVLLLLNLDRH
jgi:hypothetical protein